MRTKLFVLFILIISSLSAHAQFDFELWPEAEGEDIPEGMLELPDGTLVYESSNIGTEDIMESLANTMADPDAGCLNYCVTGVCFWLKCTIWDCEVSTTMRFKHNNPDVIISSYRDVGDNPWEEIREIWQETQVEMANEMVSLFSITGFQVAAGGENMSDDEQDSALVYREVDAIGHPLNLSDTTEYFCGSQTTNMTPVFFSSMDGYGWRLGIGEYIYTPLALPFMSVIGDPVLRDWGNVYRRIGFTMRFDEPVGNAQMAFRVGHIITRSGQPHLYTALTGEPNTDHEYFLTPPELEQNSDSGGVFQQLSPHMDEKCSIFGDESVPDYSYGRRTLDGGATYLLWRPYECCPEGEGAFIGSISMSPGICI